MTNNRRALIGLYAIAAVLALGNLFRSLSIVMQWIPPLMILAIGAASFFLTYRMTWRSGAAVVGVALLVFLSEVLGVNAGFPFGDFAFTNVLGPKLLDVPYLIVLLWLSILIPASSAAERFLKYNHVVVVAILVTAFDAVLEFAADSLDLWHWKEGMPNELNYISWFGISYFSISLLKKFANEREPNALVAHFLSAQLIYFALSDVGVRFIAPHL